jgi:predicted dithiol-disulfide oxidoreductase (DUF899 family)
LALPEVVSREQWTEARRRLLAQEKELTRQRDALNAERRRLPMVRIEKDYTFEGAKGPATLADLFDGSSQLIVQHVMLGPDWDAPCPGCSASLNELSEGTLRHMRSRDTEFILVSRAPFSKINEMQTSRGWGHVPWYSSYGTDFNYDFHVTLDASRSQLEYNYRPRPELVADQPDQEMPGHSAFLRDGDDVYHTYSTFARGGEYIGNAYTLLDLTTFGRSEDWEEPKGRAARLHGADPTFTD